jgi:hypothetical protein
LCAVGLGGTDEGAMAAMCVYKSEPDAVERVCVFVHLRRGGVTYGGVEGRGTSWGRR